MTDEVIVLQPGDEKAQKIGKAISSQTANDILHILREGPRTASDLCGAMDMPMGTVKYHIENLLDAGLLEVRETRYSVKGREIKVYALKDQLLIVTPAVKNIRDILLRYASLFAVVVLASVGIYILQPLLAVTGNGALSEPQVSEATRLEKDVGIMSQPAPSFDGSSVAGGAGGTHEAVLAFFLGGCLVIALLLVYEAYLWRKK
ncbi:MAG TPA: helix-turn-helix domain-containing protein [Methanoregulaceae archaeon]|jgi:DNA-binding transcriptional ArsR family regulator|nr:helix-turn-helix domain-containing protein [Methanolinea sp.]MCC7567621.1 helix-turn-helix domain-containing protein [Methanoregulaceae archaeon]MDD3090948.1 helix-turn-helix domain-containing protein [Methanoregulaceae archaeon]MDD5047636.1 helix-turn-helix domain-containing protein [Methanoregulaceae archaeon]HOP66323.1 helix-turn-helix domain-containing protein [Methanoregulaceae archaeon]